MERVRWILAIGGMLVCVAAPLSSARLALWRSAGAAPPRNVIVPAIPNAEVSVGIGRDAVREPAPVPLDPPQPEPIDHARLAKRTALAAEHWRQRLGEEGAVFTASPFVVAGDLSPAELAGWHARAILPAAEALQRDYFRHAPSAPVVVLLFAGERSYEHYCRELFGESGVSIYGYYKPDQRLLVLNIETGGGTLVHELTHALVDFDHPDAPAWFNEGLASLHEQSRFVATTRGVAIEGLDNWRLRVLRKALDEGRLRSLRSLVADGDFRRGDVGLNYAHARYFCLYLQERGLLAALYQRMRDDPGPDPLGAAAVARTLSLSGAAADPADADWARFDAEFRAWLETRSLPAEGAAEPLR